MNTISHADLFPHEAFPENPDDLHSYEGYKLVSRNVYVMRKRIGIERSALLGEDRNLTFQEQQGLALQIQEGKQANVKASALGTEYDGSLDEIIAAGLHAKHILVAANLPFAQYFARKTLYTLIDTDMVLMFNEATGNAWNQVEDYYAELDLDDRTQMAMLAMWVAADNYLPGKEASFTTYASWYMRRYIQQYVDANTSGFKVLDEKLREYRNAVKDCNVNLDSNRKLRPENILLGRRALSLDDITGPIAVEEETGTITEHVELQIADVVPENAVVNDDNLHEVHLVNLRWTINDLLKILSNREAEIIRLRYGLTSDGPMTCEEVGKKLSVTRQNINQIELKALQKLRQFDGIVCLEDYKNDDTYTLPYVLPSVVDGVKNITSNKTLVSD